MTEENLNEKDNCQHVFEGCLAVGSRLYWMEQRLRIEVHRDELATFSIQRHSSNPLADPEDETEQPQWHPMWLVQLQRYSSAGWLD